MKMRLSKNDWMSPAVHVLRSGLCIVSAARPGGPGVEGMDFVLPRCPGRHMVAAAIPDRAHVAVPLVKFVDRSSTTGTPTHSATSSCSAPSTNIATLATGHLRRRLSLRSALEPEHHADTQRACRQGWSAPPSGLLRLGQLAGQPAVELTDVVLTGHQNSAVAVDARVHRRLAPFASVEVLLVDPMEQFHRPADVAP